MTCPYISVEGDPPRGARAGEDGQVGAPGAEVGAAEEGRMVGLERTVFVPKQRSDGVSISLGGYLGPRGGPVLGIVGCRLFQGVPEVFPLCSRGVPVLFPMGSRGVPVVLLWCSRGVPVVPPSCPRGAPVVAPAVPSWCFRGVPMVFAWCSRGVPVVFLSCSRGVPVVFPWWSGERWIRTMRCDSRH